MEITTGLVGFKIKGLRIQHNIPIPEVAKALDITKSYLSLIENGKREPHLKVKRRAATLFNISVDDLETVSAKSRELMGIMRGMELSDIVTSYALILKERAL